MKLPRFLSPLLFAAILLQLIVTPSVAQTVYEWNDNASNNSWNNAGNWKDSSGNIPDGPNFGAFFNHNRNAGTKCYVTNQAGDIGLSRELHTYRFTGTSSAHNWRIYAKQNEVADSGVKITVNGVLQSNLASGASANLYHTLEIKGGSTVFWSATGSNITLNEPLTGSGNIDGDMTAGGGMTLKKAGTFSGLFYTGQNDVDLDHVNALQNAVMVLEDSATNRVTFPDGTTFGHLAGPGRLEIGDKTLYLGDGSNRTFSGTLVGDYIPIAGKTKSIIVKQGSGRWEIGAAQPEYGGRIEINAGTLRPAHEGAFPNGSVSVNIDGGLDLNDEASDNYQFGGLGGSGDVHIPAGKTLSITKAYSGNVLSGDLTGNALLISGGIELTGSALQAATTLDNGSLTLASPVQAPSLLNDFTFIGSSSLFLDGTTQEMQIPASFDADDSIILNNGSELILGNDNAAIDWQGELRSDEGNSNIVRKQGSGDLTFRHGSSTNRLRGAFYLENGTMKYGDGTTGGGIRFGNVINSTRIEINPGNQANTFFSSSISGGGRVVLMSGAVEFKTPNGGVSNHTFTGPLELAGGSLRIDATSELGQGPLLFNGGALITTGTNAITLPSLGILGNSSMILEVSDAAQTVSSATPLSGGIDVIKNGPGVWLLDANISHTGSTTINAGKLRLSGAMLSTSPVTIAPGAILELNSGGNLSVPVINNGQIILDKSGISNLPETISGSGSLIKRSGNTYEIKTDMTYTGGTVVEAGTLRVNATLGAGDLSLASGATLAGNGTIGGALTTSQSGTIQPGAGIGTLTFTGGANLFESRLVIEADGTDSDLLRLGASANVQNLEIEFQPVGDGFTEPVYILIRGTSYSGGLGTMTNLPAGYTVSKSYVDSEGQAVALVSTTGPRCIAFAPRDLGPTNADTLVFDVEFDRPVTKFDQVSDLDLQTTGSLSVGLNSIAGSGTTYTVTLDLLGGEGTLTAAAKLSGNGSTDISDGVGQALDSSVTSPAVSVDKVGPLATISADTASPTNDETLVFSIDFSEPVNAVVPGDLAIVSGGVSHGPPQISGSADSWAVTFNSVAGDGTLSLDLAASTAIRDSIGNAPDNDPEAASVAVDQTGPAATITADTESPTNLDTVEFSVEFDEAVEALTVGDLEVGFTGDGFSAPSITGDGQSWTVTVGSVTGSGTLTLDLSASTAIQDALGNALRNDPEAASVAIDQTSPVATITAGTASPTNSDAIAFSVDFSEPIQNLTLPDLAASFSGTSSNEPQISGGGASWTVTIDGLIGSGIFTLGLADSNGILDATGNALGTSAANAEIFVKQFAQWISPVSGDWNTPENWEFDSPADSTTPATFGMPALSGDIAVNLAADRSIVSLTFEGPANFTLGGGRLTLSDGAVYAAGTGSHVIDGDLHLAQAGVMDLDAPVRINGAVSGADGFTKSGDATLTLAGANTFAGGVSVAEGTLEVVSTAGAQTINVAAGATLSGSGSTGPVVAVDDSSVSGTLEVTGDSSLSGRIFPGGDASFGEMRFTGYTDIGRSTLNFDIDGEQSDHLFVDGALRVWRSDLIFNEVGQGATKSYYIVATADGFPENFGSITNLPSGYVVSKGYSVEGKNTVALVVSAPPNCVAITPRQSDPTNAGTLVFDVQFDKPIRKFTRASDLTITKDAGLDLTFQSITGADAEYVVTYTVSGNGGMTIAVDPDDGGQDIDDQLGNNLASSVTATITVDQTPPVLNLMGDDPYYVGYQSSYVDPGATVTDNLDSSVTVVIAGDTVDTAAPGSYLITYDATDNAGNAATTLTRTVIVRNAYDTWAAFHNLVGDDALPSADPDHDNKSNLWEFGFHDNPSSGTSAGRRGVAIVEKEGNRHLVLTVPIRSGAIFEGSGPLSATIDGITYIISGSDDLSEFTEELTVAPAAEDVGLPALDSGWEYRTFWLERTLETQGFLQHAVELAE